MTAITAPQLAPVAPSTAAAPVQLQLGQILSGTVIALLNDATLRLQTPAGLLDIVADTPLPPGTQVAISVQGTAQQPELVITPVQNGSSPPLAQLSVGSNGVSNVQAGANPDDIIATTAASANSSATSIAEAGDQPGTALRIAPPLMQAALSAAAMIVRDAAAAQGSLTTLYSNLEAAVTTPAPALPAPVLAAARQLLTMQLDITSGHAIDANDIKVALMRSGLVAGSPVAGALPQNVDVADLGAGLIVLRQALKTWLDQETDPKTAATPQNPAATAPSPRANAASANAPIPPYRGGPSTPQPPAAPSLSPLRRRANRRSSFSDKPTLRLRARPCCASARWPAINKAAQRKAPTIRRA